MNKTNLGFILRYFPVVILLIAPFVLPIFNFAFNVGIALTVISLLFTILIGFFIAAATNDALHLQTFITRSNGDLIALFNLSKLIQPSATAKISDAIDRYMIAVLDFNFIEYVPKTEKEFKEIVETIDELKPKEKVMERLFPVLHTIKTDLFIARQEIALSAKTIVSQRHWFILISLAILVSILFLTLRDGHWFAALLNGIILVAIYQVLLLLRDIDTNLFVEKRLAYEDPQRVFQAIGKLKYYPEIAITDRRIKEPQESYRLGIYKNYPQSTGKEIRIIERGTS